MKFKIGDRVKWSKDAGPSTDQGLITDLREDGWLGVIWNGSHTTYSPPEHLQAPGKEPAEAKKKHA